MHEAGHSHPYLPASLLLSAFGIFLIDAFTPLGIGDYILYFVPVALTIFAEDPRLPLHTVTLTSILSVMGFILSPPSDSNYQRPLLNRVIALFTIWAVAWMARKILLDKRSMKNSGWLKQGLAELSVALAGELSKEQIGNIIVRFYNSSVNMKMGACYERRTENNMLVLIGDYALPQNFDRTTVSLEDGFIGQTIRDQKLGVLSVTGDFYQLASATVKGRPPYVIVSPFSIDGEVYGAIEASFLENPDETVLQLFKDTSEAIATALRTCQYTEKLNELLLETQEQAQELQAQQEELRVSNEELEQQSTSIKDSYARLENQQAELERSNQQLEHQKGLIGQRNKELTQIQSSLLEKTRDLERAGQYKSEFLANMSHELRTPLNSTLILAKLLADNRQGNLTEEQVKQAQIIHSSGNDLLALINDILDLSKVEAGKLTVEPGHITLDEMVEGLKKTFMPVAQHKGLNFNITIADGLPPKFVSDRQRLEQILRNFLSNAFKFTEKGVVCLSVNWDGKEIHFSVNDTGIGIPPEQERAIFEAFRQADGTIGRKYGGTGLGLSISRELARLLGGMISVHSTPGSGSTFTFSLPFVSPSRQQDPPPPQEAPAPQALQAPPVDSSKDDRRILIVEGDASEREHISHLLMGPGIRIDPVSSAEAALDELTHHTYDCMVMDLLLPDMPGDEFLDKLADGASPYSYPPVIIYTSRDISPEEEERLRQFSSSIIIKGARSPERLLSEVTLFLGKTDLPPERRKMLRDLRHREKDLEDRTILVVDDDVRNIFALTALFEAHGAKIEVARNGRQSLESLEAHPKIDLVLMDVMMPEMDGYEAMRRISSDGRYGELPVIALTAKTMRDDQDKCLAAGANDYLSKPIAMDKLVSLVRVWLRGKGVPLLE